MEENRLYRLSNVFVEAKDDRKRTMASREKELDKSNKESPCGGVSKKTSSYVGAQNGFLGNSSSDRLTEEQRENIIAENIYDWWISKKSYKKWYADKISQQEIKFNDE